MCLCAHVCINMHACCRVCVAVMRYLMARKAHTHKRVHRTQIHAHTPALHTHRPKYQWCVRRHAQTHLPRYISLSASAVKYRCMFVHMTHETATSGQSCQHLEVKWTLVYIRAYIPLSASAATISVVGAASSVAIAIALTADIRARLCIYVFIVIYVFVHICVYVWYT